MIEGGRGIGETQLAEDGRFAPPRHASPDDANVSAGRTWRGASGDAVSPRRLELSRLGGQIARLRSELVILERAVRVLGRAT
jgi:hypothetical protein